MSGIINFKTRTKLFLFIGAKGEDQTSLARGAYGKGGYNGGGNGGVDLADNESPESAAGGGGSTDIRIINEQNVFGWKSRIIVAAAGGGGVSSSDSIGSGGGELIGLTKSDDTNPGTQTSGIFGKGGNGISVGTINVYTGGSTGGAGSGYYGGYTKPESELPLGSAWFFGSGAGGSSYISGYPGCNSVKFDKSDTITHTGNSKHSSGFVFKNGVMMSAFKRFNKPGSDTKEIGHSGNGAAVITFLEKTYFPTEGNSRKLFMFGIYYYIVVLLY